MLLVHITTQFRKQITYKPYSAERSHQLIKLYICQTSKIVTHRYDDMKFIPQNYRDFVANFGIMGLQPFI